MLKFLRLVRWPNLVIVALTQYIMRYLIVEPILFYYRFELQLSHFQFFVLVATTVLLTAAGYVINDYFDVHTDRLNKPKRVLIGKDISRRTAIIFHSILNVIAIAMGTWLSFSIKLPVLSLGFLLISGLLWFYSTTYKRQLFVGNFIVALLTALVPFIVVVFEIPVLNSVFEYQLKAEGISLNVIFYWITGFSFFAFVLTLIREIVKDIEDFEGDKAYGRNTIPIQLGTAKTKQLLAGLVVLTIVALLMLFFKFLLYSPNGDLDVVSMIYIFVLIILPLLVLMLLISMASEKKHYSIASLLTKLIMLSGILYAFVFRYIVLSSF